MKNKNAVSTILGPRRVKKPRHSEEKNSRKSAASLCKTRHLWGEVYSSSEEAAASEKESVHLYRATNSTHLVPNCNVTSSTVIFVPLHVLPINRRLITSIEAHFLRRDAWASKGEEYVVGRRRKSHLAN